jgi:hypothetical protein
MRLIDKKANPRNFGQPLPTVRMTGTSQPAGKSAIVHVHQNQGVCTKSGLDFSREKDNKSRLICQGMLRPLNAEPRTPLACRDEAVSSQDVEKAAEKREHARREADG